VAKRRLTVVLSNFVEYELAETPLCGVHVDLEIRLAAVAPGSDVAPIELEWSMDFGVSPSSDWGKESPLAARGWRISTSQSPSASTSRVYSPSSIKAAVSPSYSPIAFTNRSSNSPPTRLTWKLLSPLVCVASTTVNPHRSGRLALLRHRSRRTTAPRVGRPLRSVRVLVVPRRRYLWFPLRAPLCSSPLPRCWLVWLFSLFGRSVAAP